MQTTAPVSVANSLKRRERVTRELQELIRSKGMRIEGSETGIDRTISDWEWMRLAEDLTALIDRGKLS